MTIAIIVPVKSSGRKSRLSGLLGRPEREEFARLLLVDVLRALKVARLLSSTWVVSPDESILGLASRAGSRTLKEPGDAGVNAAVFRGLGPIAGGSRALVLPADLPLLKGSEVRRFIEMTKGLDVGIAPSKGFDGTNALLFSSRLRLSYDHDSFWNHLSGAAREGLSVGVCTEPGLMFDVDTPEDMRMLARSGSDRPSAKFARRTTR